MKKQARVILEKTIQILFIAFLSFSLDYLIVVLSGDDSIWLGEAVESVGSVIFGPAVGGLATLLSCIVTDFLTYGTFQYSFVAIFESSSMALIGAIYRRLNKDDNEFGMRQIVIFNFVQVLVNAMVLYLSTPPAAVIFFGSIFDDWTRQNLVEEMAALGNNAFSACISIALIGTAMLSSAVIFRRRVRASGSILGAWRSIRKCTFVVSEYRTRSREFTVGVILAIALSMVDGVVSGHVLGPDALAATSLMVPLISLSTFLSTCFCYGCSSLCAIAKGEGDYEKSRRLFSLGFFATLVSGIIQTILFFFAQDLYFGYFASSETIGAFASEYYQIYILVPPFMAMATFLDTMALSDGDEMLTYIGYLTSVVVNIVASVFLSKSMGMRGLALGTVLSYICYLSVVAVHFFKKSNTCRLRLWFSFSDLLDFAKHSLNNNASGFCKSAVSTAFTKAILMFWGSEYLVANTVLCAMLEIYQMLNGPSEAAGFMLSTYTGEKNAQGIRTLFREALRASLIIGLNLSLVLLLVPNSVLFLYGIDDSPIRAELIACIRYCSVGMLAAIVGEFLSDYYGYTGKPLWSCMLVIFQTALFPILFCVTFCLDGVVAMGRGLLLAEIFSIAIFYGFVLIIKGSDSIPFMLDDPDFKKVKMDSFEYRPEEYERICAWIQEGLRLQGIDDTRIDSLTGLVRSLLEKTAKKNDHGKVLGECVLRFTEDPRIIIKDNGKLFEPDLADERLCYNVLLSCNCNTIRIS